VQVVQLPAPHVLQLLVVQAVPSTTTFQMHMIHVQHVHLERIRLVDYLLRAADVCHHVQHVPQLHLV